MHDTCETTDKIYIINNYRRYSKDDVVFTFRVYGREYAVIRTTLNWGKPVLSNIEDSAADWDFHIYTSLDEVRTYVRKLKQLEGRKF